MDYWEKEKIENWNREKQEHVDKRNILLQQYSKSVQMILDDAAGTNFDPEDESYSQGRVEGFTFLEDLDITGFNFAGMSLDGQPITREMLVAQGLKGADKAIVIFNDIINLEDEERRNALSARLETLLQAQGRIISQEGVVNLVPLALAAKKGLLDVVQVRLSAGIDPNQKTEDGLQSCPAIVAAAKGGFYDVVKLLSVHPDIDKRTRISAAQEAKKMGHTEIADYLCSLMDVNEKDPEGDALIHKAVKAANIPEIQRLLSRGADINLETNHGYTPLYIAATNVSNIRKRTLASEEDIQLLEFLLANGADPNKYKGDRSREFSLKRFDRF